MIDSHRRLAVIGVGLLGGSFALRARQCGVVSHVVGCDLSAHVGTTAGALGLIDEFVTDPLEAVRDADLVLVATPPRVIVEIMERIAPVLKARALVMDVGSTKQLVHDVDSIWTGPGFFVGAHSMAGTERTGPDAAHASLFDGAVTLLTPTEHTDSWALGEAKRIWEALGTRVQLMDANRHDEVMVTVSHLPHLTAYALCCVANDVHGEYPEIEGLYGGGFKDTTRIASTPPTLWRDVFELNQANLLAGLDRFDARLAALRQKIVEGRWDEVEADLQGARKGRAWVLYTGDERST